MIPAKWWLALVMLLAIGGGVQASEWPWNGSCFWKSPVAQVREAIAAREKRAAAIENEIADIIKQYNRCYREGKYRDAWLIAMRGHDIDPDNLAIQAAILQANMATGNCPSEEIEKAWGGWEYLETNDDSGSVLNIHASVTLAKESDKQAKNQQGLSYIQPPTRNARERDIERKLLIPVNLNFKDTPLQTVIDSLAGMHDTNIVPDLNALEEAGVNMDQPLSLKVENISLKSALNLLLKQANLTYVIQNEVLTITTKELAKSKPKTVTYPVADLVTPIDNRVLSILSHDEFKNNSSAITTPVESLLRLIMRAIEPNSWSEAGGKGTLQFLTEGRVLVVTQYQDIQEDVVDLLAALRRLHADEFKQYQIQLVLVDATGQTYQPFCPNLRCFRGQTATVHAGQAFSIKYYTIDDLLPPYSNILASSTIILGFPGQENGYTKVQVGKTVQVQLLKTIATQPKLDLTYQENAVEHAGNDGIDVAGTSHRFLRPVELGKMAKLPLQRDDNGTLRRWLEVTVTEVSQTPPTTELQVNQR